jgi:hypothetical protein
VYVRCAAVYISNLSFDSLCPSAETALAAGFAFCVGSRPVLEFVGEEFPAEVGDALRHAGLGVGDGLVVDRGADFFKEEAEQETGRHIADGLKVLFEVALHGRDGVGALLFAEFKGGHGPAPGDEPILVANRVLYADDVCGFVHAVTCSEPSLF